MPSNLTPSPVPRIGWFLDGPGRRLWCAAGPAGAAVFSTGCEKMNDRLRGTAQGAGVGAVAGAVPGSVSGGNAGRGAVLQRAAVA